MEIKGPSIFDHPMQRFESRRFEQNVYYSSKFQSNLLLHFGLIDRGLNAFDNVHSLCFISNGL